MNVHKKAFELYKKKRIKVEVISLRRIHFKVMSREEHSVIYDKIQKNFFCDCKYFTLKLKECSHIKACKLLLKKGVE